jgi:hypothetical protein
MYFTPRDRTNIFLSAIAPSEYADVVRTLETSVNAYLHPEDNGDLQDNLCIDGIAMMIHQNYKHRIRDIPLPRIHRTAGSASSWDLSEEDNFGYCHIQGYCPQVNRTKQPRDRGFGSSPRGFSRYGDCNGDGLSRFGDCNGVHHPPDCAGTQGCLARPNQHHCPYQPGVQCNACKRLGHTAANCDMLAMALFLERYTTKDLFNADWTSIETK